MSSVAALHSAVCDEIFIGEFQAAFQTYRGAPTCTRP
jgi:hypothetical protein